MINLRVACAPPRIRLLRSADVTDGARQTGFRLHGEQPERYRPAEVRTARDAVRCHRPHRTGDHIQPGAPAIVVQGTSPARDRSRGRRRSAMQATCCSAKRQRHRARSCWAEHDHRHIRNESVPLRHHQSYLLAADSIGNKASTTFTIRSSTRRRRGDSGDGGRSRDGTRNVTLQATSPAGAVYTFSASATITWTAH